MTQASCVKWSAVQLPLFNLSHFLLCHIEEAHEIGVLVDAKFPSRVESMSIPAIGIGEKPSDELPVLEDYKRCRIDALNILQFRASDTALRAAGLSQEADDLLAIFDGYFGNAKGTYEYVAILLGDIMRRGVAN